MMYSQLFDTLYYKAEHTKPTEENPDVEFLRLKYHVRFMMDEFANIGKIPEFPTKISTMRKYNISCTVCLLYTSRQVLSSAMHRYRMRLIFLMGAEKILQGRSN